MKPKIYFMRELLPQEEEVVKDQADYKMFTGWNITREIVAKETKDVDAISTNFPSYTYLDEEVLRNAKKLKVINVGTNTFHLETYVGHGLNVDVATELGIYITNTPVSSEGVADKTWALILAVARRVVEADRWTREGNWKESNTAHYRFVGYQVHDKTLGIIGLGKIGAIVARRARGFNMRVIYYDIIRKKDLENKLGAEYVDFDTLLKESDFVSLHTGPVHHLIGERELSLMKKNTILINTARGMCVDTIALYNALKNGKIAGAGIDVFPGMKAIEPNNPITSLSNVVLTPNMSSYIENYVKTMKMGFQNIMNVLNEKMPLSLVNTEVIKIRPLKND